MGLVVEGERARDSHLAMLAAGMRALAKIYYARDNQAQVDGEPSNNDWAYKRCYASAIADDLEAK
jgi:hypothetical protein